MTVRRSADDPRATGMGEARLIEAAFVERSPHPSRRPGAARRCVLACKDDDSARCWIGAAERDRWQRPCWPCTQRDARSGWFALFPDRRTVASGVGLNAAGVKPRRRLPFEPLTD